MIRNYNKYEPNNSIICAAEHDIIHSLSLNDLIEKWIKTDDAITLSKFNWFDYDGYLSHFV